MKTVTYIETNCVNCGTSFQWEETLRNQRKSDGGSFYCPNGHKQHFTLSFASEMQKVREELAEVKQDLEIARNEVTRLKCEALKSKPTSGLGRFFG